MVLFYEAISSIHAKPIAKRRAKKGPEMGVTSPERKPSGCGLLNAVFGRSSLFSKRAASYGSISAMDTTPNNNVTRSTSTPNSQRRKGGSDDVAFASIDDSRNPSWVPSQVHHQKIQNRTIGSNGVQGRGCSKTTATQGYVNQGKRVPKEAVGISGELESMIVDHQKTKGSSTLVRASSSNVMLYGDLGNLRQPANSNPNPNPNPNSTSNPNPNRNPKPNSNSNPNPNPNPNRNPNTMLNGDVPLTERSTEGNNKRGRGPTASLCRGISTRMDPEQLKIMGNEDYKNGRFAEALVLYEAAIAIDPNKAAYRSNKSAALTALGRLLDALFECKEAILIEPRHHRTHNRMATLYVRLGEAENAIYHYKLAGPDADPDVISRAKAVQAHLQKCADARRVKDWSSLIRECGRAISAGADSAPQIFALQAEAFLKLHRHDEAVHTLSNGPNFEVEACTKFLGPIGNANLLAVRAQVDMAAGRFDDAVEAAQRAAQLDPDNKEVNVVLRKSRAVTVARSKGNELFKVGRFDEASAAYGEGLQHEPYNSVLLCNRAACRSKVGQLERAIEDCNAALNVRPSYRKAMLRRADCNAKLGKWEASIHDYEVLIRDSPDDEEVSRALSEAKLHLKRQRQTRQTSENGH